MSVDVRVKTTKHTTCLPFCVPCPRPGVRGRDRSAGVPSASVPIMTDPDPGIRPDLVALPAWGITIDHQRTDDRDFLDFGATVWNKGPSPMVVEGFRRPGEAIMDGWEYFYANGEPVGRAPAGDLMYDARPGTPALALRTVRPRSLARRGSNTDRPQREDRLLSGSHGCDRHDGPRCRVEPVFDRTRHRLRQSELDLDTGGAPDRMGRHLLPGTPRAIVRHHRPPQPHPTSSRSSRTPTAYCSKPTANNTELREIKLRGKPGHRRVIVPLWHRIDTEGNGEGGGGVRSPARVGRVSPRSTCATSAAR